MKPSRSMSIIIDDRKLAQPNGRPNQRESTVEERQLKKAQFCMHSQYSMPCSLNSRRVTQSSYQIHHSLLDEQIVYCQLSLAAKKDFNEEVRALLDVRKFVSDSFILIDISEIRIGAILVQIIDRLVECRQLGEQVAEEAKSLLFVDRNSLNMVLASTMQGIYKSRTDGRLAYDHSWIVATCSLGSLHKRQVAIARFPQPVNFGRQSREVRFLVVVLAPSKEKLTKTAWETGRTFATMFTDIEFRRRLLRAKGQDELKAELLVRAEALAREGETASQNTTANSSGLELLTTNDTIDNGGLIAGLGRFNSDSLDKRLLPTWQAKQLLMFQSNAINSFALDSSLVSSKRPLASFQPQSSFDSNSSSAAAAAAATAANKQTQKGAKQKGPCCPPITSLGSGLINDLKRRAQFYLSDFTDGFLGERSLYKTISTTIFLYFSVLLPCIAFGVVDTNNTDGAIDPRKTMIGQALGGLFFALFSGQPLVVVMTTAPLCIYVKVIYQISQDLELDFGSFYAAVGLWMCLFLVIMSLTNSSDLMKYCTRSTEDIFALFTAFAFGSDGVKEAVRSFNKYYWDPECAGGLATLPSTIIGSSGSSSSSSASMAPGHVFVALQAQQQHQLTQPSNISLATHHEMVTQNGNEPHSGAGDHMLALHRCQREACILFLFLMSGTLWLANSFNAFDRTPYLSSRKREIIKDYALAIAVLIFSFIGSYLFADVRLDVFEFGDSTGLHFIVQLSPQLLSVRAMATSALLGFMLAVLFYIDQNICGAMVNNAPYKLEKGDYFHLDLLVLAVLNALLSLTGLPWMHGKLPHSHLHSKALADYEERVDEGHIHQMIVNIRETRLTGLLVSLLIALSLLAIPYPLAYIPLPVLSGVFLYTALAEFKSNSMIERVCLLFTEQAAYPPNHYIRRCPQRKIHFFTLAQLIQLAIVSFIGFYPNPYVNMAFPLVVATFVPVRVLFLPRLIDAKYLSSLDGASLE